MEEVIQRVLDARDQAMMDEARECYGARNMREAHHWLESEGRILTVNGDDGLTYVVFDFELQKRSKYEACLAWSKTEEGRSLQ